MFEPFSSRHGAADAATRIPLDLDHPDLVAFHAETGGGVFGHGLISFLSAREAVTDLGGWEIWLPPGARLIGTSAFGLLFVLADGHLWIVDTQYGQVIESDWTIERLINFASDEAFLADFLREGIFSAWHALTGQALGTDVLTPTPAPVLGGDWDLTTLSRTPLAVHLHFTAQLFEAGGDNPAEVRRL